MQTANPHADAATIPIKPAAEATADKSIEQEVAELAERENPYGWYKNKEAFPLRSGRFSFAFVEKTKFGGHEYKKKEIARSEVTPKSWTLN